MKTYFLKVPSSIQELYNTKNENADIVTKYFKKSPYYSSAKSCDLIRIREDDPDDEGIYIWDGTKAVIPYFYDEDNEDKPEEYNEIYPTSYAYMTMPFLAFRHYQPEDLRKSGFNRSNFVYFDIKGIGKIKKLKKYQLDFTVWVCVVEINDKNYLILDTTNKTEKDFLHHLQINHLYHYEDVDVFEGSFFKKYTGKTFYTFGSEKFLN